MLAVLGAFGQLVLLIEKLPALVHLLRVAHIDFAVEEDVARSQPEAAHREVGLELWTCLHKFRLAVQDLIGTHLD